MKWSEVHKNIEKKWYKMDSNIAQPDKIGVGNAYRKTINTLYYRVTINIFSNVSENIRGAHGLTLTVVG